MKTNKCPIFETCSKFRKEAEEKFQKKDVWVADRTTCYCPSWLLDNKKQCENYHPELIPQLTKKITKSKKTYEELREEIRKPHNAITNIGD